MCVFDKFLCFNCSSLFNLYADKIIRAKKAEKDDEKYLKIKKDIPILEMEHIVYSKNNVPIEYAIVHYKSDIYELHFITPR